MARMLPGVCCQPMESGRMVTRSSRPFMMAMPEATISNWALAASSRSALGGLLKQLLAATCCSKVATCNKEGFVPKANVESLPPVRSAEREPAGKTGETCA